MTPFPLSKAGPRREHAADPPPGAILEEFERSVYPSVATEFGKKVAAEHGLRSNFGFGDAHCFHAIHAGNAVDNSCTNLLRGQTTSQPA
jgi:hypothetical protein